MSDPEINSAKNTRSPRQPQSQGLNKAAYHLLTRIGNTVVVVTHTTMGALYTLPDGVLLSKRAIENLLASGWLAPANDGLFPGMPQTLRAVALGDPRRPQP